ncbi:MAG: organic solvent tolerance protein OstA, partial [Beijerinckiaceae bacterium]|nr:organic solvent tolerance protein OstA [Beijerinckiaceae bacterium]
MTSFGRYRLAGCALIVSLGAICPAAAEKPRSGAILPGSNPSEPVNIDAAKLDYFDKDQKLVYSG